MQYALELETRELLQEELDELELAVEEFYPSLDKIVAEFDRKILGHQRHNWFAKIEADTGESVWQSDNFEQVGPGVTVDPLGNGKTSFLQSDGNIRAWRSIEVGPDKEWMIVLGEPTEFIRRDMQRLTLTLLIIGAIFLFVAPVGGYFLARNAMRPVQQIVESTQKLNPSRLDDRLPIRGTNDELDRISLEINRFLDLLSQYLSSQKEFIANASHELRSPLTAIQTSVEVCLEQARSEAVYREQLETVSEQCEFLRRLVNQLLDLAESEATSPISKSEFDLASAVQTCVSIFGGVADEKEISIRCDFDKPIYLVGDQSKIILVINNLIDNAIKYSQQGGVIELAMEQTPKMTRLVVQDSGPGVPEDLLAKIFDRFFQVDNARKREGSRGNGLGLSICKSVIESHGGRIFADNHHGLRVQFEIPRAELP